MKHNKKGQAAMEFLMTYGWAILAAIIVVGVLWVLIGNPTDLAGDKYVISNPFVAEAKQLKAGAVVDSATLEIRNGAGESVTIHSIDLGGCSLNNTLVIVPANTVFSETFNCGTDLVSNDRFVGKIIVTYSTRGSNLNQTASGDLSAQVP